MNCKEFREKMDVVFYGEVEEKTEREFRNHIKKCKTCENIWKNYIKMKVVIKEHQDHSRRKKFAIAVATGLLTTVVALILAVFNQTDQVSSPTHIAKRDSTKTDFSFLPAAQAMFSVSDENFFANPDKSNQETIDILDL